MKALFGPNGKPVKFLSARAFYEASSTGANRSTLSGTLQSATRDITKSTRREISRKARYLYKNSPFIRGLVERMVTYVVGTGLTPSPASSDKAWNKIASDAWTAWTTMADAISRAAFGTLQRIAYRSMLIDGDSFTYLTYDESGRPRLQLFEGHQITSSETTGTKPIAPDGVLLSASGRPQWFVLYDEEMYRSTNLPADSVIPHLIPERPAQYRGISIFTSAIHTAHDMDDILALEKAAVKSCSTKTDIIKTESGEWNAEDVIVSDGSVLNPDSDEERVQYYRQQFSPEAVLLKRGDEYTPYKSDRPSSAWSGFMEFLSQTICLSVGIPPSILLQMKVGGADTRRDLAAAQRVFEIHQAELISQFQRIWEYVIGSEINNGYLGRAPKDWRNVAWQTPKAPTVDAGREAQQDREDVKMGMLSLREYYGRYGMSWEDELEQIAQEQATIRQVASKYGLKPEDIQLRNPNQLQPQPVPAMEGDKQ